jgi:hypothetical protein
MQIYSTPNGPALKVRTELREGETKPEHMFVSVRDRLVYTEWHKEVPPEFELIHDPAASRERDLATLELVAQLGEKAVFVECMQAALGMLDERSAEQIRDIYRTRIEQAEIISLTKPANLVSLKEA